MQPLHLPLRRRMLLALKPAAVATAAGLGLLGLLGLPLGALAVPAAGAPVCGLLAAPAHAIAGARDLTRQDRVPAAAALGLAVATPADLLVAGLAGPALALQGCIALAAAVTR